MEPYDEFGIIEQPDIVAIMRKFARMENRAPTHLVEAPNGPNYFLIVDISPLSTPANPRF